MIWFVMLATGFVTFLMRVSMFSGLIKRPLPDAVEDVLKFVPTAILSAIVSASIFIDKPTQEINLLNNFSVAALMAAGVAFVTRSVLWTIAIGMAVLWGLGLI
jgi:branched-subunit amino acid transport protein